MHNAQKQDTTRWDLELRIELIGLSLSSSVLETPRTTLFDGESTDLGEGRL